MNTTEIVALIAAGSGVTVAGVAFVGNAVTAWANARQAQARIAADHSAWLRDRRAEVYIQMNILVRTSAWKRIETIKDGEASPALLSTVTQLLAYYGSSEMWKLSADGTTFVNHKLGFAFEHALITNWQAWKLFINLVQATLTPDAPGCHIVMTEDIRQALDEAQVADRKVYQLIKLDVQWTEYSGKHFRARQRAERRQCREYEKLREHEDYSYGPPTWRISSLENHRGASNGQSEEDNTIPSKDNLNLNR